MAISIVMPALEMAQETGKVVLWRKKEGERVAKGELLLDVETDKAVVEIESPGEGILAGISAQQDAVVPVGQTIAWLVQPGETPPKESAPAQTGRRTDSGAASQTTQAASAPEPAAVGAGRMSPKARRLAKEHGIDTGRVRGTGPDGEILASDILALVESQKATPTAAAAPVVAPADVAQGFPPSRDRFGEARRSLAGAPNAATALPGVRTTPASWGGLGWLGVGGSPAGAGAASPDIQPIPSTLSTIGRLMAERTTQSWTSVPHFFVARDVDAGALVAAHEKLAPDIERAQNVKATLTDLLIALVARVLPKHPHMNASWTGDGIRPNPDVNIGLAIAVNDGVVAAVVPKADRMSLGDIALRRRDLAQRARDGKLRPPDITGATFTISNLGMYQVDAFTAIIVPPQAGILTVGAITDRVVPLDHRGIGVRPIMTITLSCDHRVVDGAKGALFLNDVVEAVRDPQKWLG